MASKARINVWCEDRAHESFAREVLCSLGVNKRSIEYNTAPRGAGSASTWVIKQFEVAAEPRHRATRHQRNLGFLVLVDGDNVGVAGRLKALGDPEPAAGMAILVPTWSIETWVLHLLGQDVSEDQPTKERLPQSEFATALVTALGTWSEPRPDESTKVPSLARARVELDRLPI